MKPIFRSVAATVAMLAVCATAFAGGLPENFKTDNGKIIQTVGALSVERVDGAINVRQPTGIVQSFSDVNGTAWANMMFSAAFNSHYVQNPGTQRYMNTTVTTEISCISNQTAFGYPSAQPEWFADGCRLYAAVARASN